MCVLSMVIDHHFDKWKHFVEPYVFPSVPFAPPYPLPPEPASSPVTREELEEFRRWFEEAKEYDQRHNEPDCEMTEKKKRLLDLAKELGVEKEVVEILEHVGEKK